MKTATQIIFRGMHCFAALLTFSHAFADSVVPQEGVRADMAKSYIDTYARYNNDKYPKSWEEVAESGLFVSGPVSLLPVGRGISESFSFVSEPTSGKFSEGVLVLISYEAVAWPDVWKSEVTDVDLNSLTDEQRAELQPRVDRALARSKPLRYLIYRDAQGRFRSEWWYEDRVQAMLKETGITIPRPTPYYPKGPDGEYLPLTSEAIAALIRLDLTDTIPPELAAKMQAAGMLPAPRPPRSPGATASDATSPPTPASTLALITSSPWTGWAALAIILVGIGLWLRHQRTKRG